jgi:hypothetical protein
MNWGDILKALGSTAIILGVAAYIAKKLIETWLAGRLAAHKSDLDHASETALERLRYELRVAEAQRSRLLARQATIVAGVFARVERLHQALAQLSRPIEHKGGKAKALRDAAAARFEEFETYYYERAIWLDVGINTQLNELATLMRKLLNQMHFNLRADGEVADRPKWVETMTRLQNDVPVARGALDRQFRALLGVVTPTAPAGELVTGAGGT